MWKNCVAQPVGRPDSSDGRALEGFARGPGFDSRSGPVIFPHIFINVGSILFISIFVYIVTNLEFDCTQHTGSL